MLKGYMVRERLGTPAKFTVLQSLQYCKVYSLLFLVENVYKPVY